MKLGFDAISGLANWLLTLGSFGDDVKKEIKQRLPGFLGLSLEDERLFADMRTQLTTDEDLHLTDFLATCEDYERNRFRNVVAGMPKFSKKTETGNGKDKKTVTEETSNAVKFLKRIADLTKTHGRQKAYDLCVTGGVISEDPFVQKALKVWRESVIWFKQKVLSVIGVKNLGEIDLKLANEKLSEVVKFIEEKIINIALKPIEDWVKKEEGKKWYVRMFTFF